MVSFLVLIWSMEVFAHWQIADDDFKLDGCGQKILVDIYCTLFRKWYFVYILAVIVLD